MILNTVLYVVWCQVFKVEQWETREFLVRILELVIVAVTSLSACSSFKPVYGDGGVVVAENGKFRFSPPQSRLDQIIYQNMLLTLGQSRSSAR